MSQDAEHSIIDYARFYGLIRDHLEPHPLDSFIPPHNLLSQLEDPPGLFQIDASNVKVPEERLSLDAGAVSLLSSIATSAKRVPRDDADHGLDTHRFGRLKQELPLLRSDHEVDMLRFAPRIVPDLEHEFLPFETVDEEADEGLTWPSACYELPSEYSKKLRSEKLQVSIDTLQYLQQTLRFHLKGGVHEAFEHDGLPYKRRPAPEPVSPPLLPLSPIAEPFTPSSDTCRLDLLSEHTSPTREEARQVERTIFDEDAIVPAKKQADSGSQASDPMLLNSEDTGDIYSPLKGIKDPPSSPPPLRGRLQDRKVSVPLSSPRSEQLPPWKRKSVSFSEALLELTPELPSPIPRPEGTSSDDIDAFIQDAIAPIAIKAERSIEQEQLQEADTTLRVPVPFMDFSLPVAPWKANRNRPRTDNEEDAYKKELAEMKALHFSKHVWPMSGKSERELKWAPFPAALGRVETQEAIPDDGTVARLVAQPDRVDVNTLTWKPEGLRILDELADSDEEELEEGVFPEERDIDSLIRKRKLELDEEEDENTLLPERDRKVTVTKASNQSTKGMQTQKPEHVLEFKKTGARGGFVEHSFSAAGALDDYISLRKGQVEKPKLKADHYFPKQPSIGLPEPTVRTDPPKRDLQQEVHPPPPRSLSLPSPNITVPTLPCPFIVSTSFLSNRKLSRQVQRLFPSAEFIARDFTLHQQHRQPISSKPNTTPTRTDTIANEADMLLSPSTGLIWTTLQKIKQRSLPGQAARSPIRERLLLTSPRYERLLILISQDIHTGHPLDLTRANLDNSDCEALTEFTAFCTNLPDEKHPLFIGGNEEDLARWVVAMMIKHGLTDPETEIKLLQEETLWEVFLRRAGMNAFAAQAVLGKLKAPLPDQGGSGGVGEFGLAAFVKMSAEERYARFETLLGGRRLLGRVGKVLDTRW